MSQEALKLPPYLNASYEGDDLFTGDQVRELLANHCEDNLNMVEQKQGEPVAWMDADGNVSDNNDHKCFPIPLYTTPQPKREQQLLETFWRIVEYLGIEDEFAKNPKGKPSDVFIEAIKKREAQPKRKPLTDDQIDDLARTMVKGDKSVNWLARAIEAAHGIKE